MKIKNVIVYLKGLIICFLGSIVFFIEIILKEAFDIDLVWSIGFKKLLSDDEYLLKKIDAFNNDKRGLKDVIE